MQNKAAQFSENAPPDDDGRIFGCFPCLIGTVWARVDWAWRQFERMAYGGAGMAAATGKRLMR
ncbi:YeeE/YedE family protein [Neisseria bacilliformis ATCC BAA-1200]|uniref:YeeE/YedE family protein n=1 Tax=Neisseria bacilliformis ATCC BAA-1200 TaxID=888742 RepID=F2B9A9_9NEIS|nr:YeeE/YedE family protein [Neisseria bacilliformis ATCC BAA-1200]